MVKVVKPFSESGILPRRNGGPLQRVAFNLKKLNYVNVRAPSRAWHVLSGVALLCRHLFTGTDPHQVFVHVLAAYILLRLSAGTPIASYKGSFDMERYEAISAVANPFIERTLQHYWIAMPDLLVFGTRSCKTFDTGMIFLGHQMTEAKAEECALDDEIEVSQPAGHL